MVDPSSEPRQPFVASPGSGLLSETAAALDSLPQACSLEA